MIDASGAANNFTLGNQTLAIANNDFFTLAANSSATIYGDGNTATGGPGSRLISDFNDATSQLTWFQPNSATASESQLYSGPNASGALVKDQAIDTSGTTTTQYNDVFGNPIATIQVDSKGNIIQGSFASNVTIGEFSEVAAGALATQIISQIIFKNNLPASAAAQAFSTLALQNLFSKPGSANQANFASLTPSQQLVANYAATFALIAANIGGSVAGAKLFKELDLPPQIGAVAGGVVSQQAVADIIAYAKGTNLTLTGATSAANGVNIISNLDSALASAGGAAIGDYVGTELSDLVIGTPNEGSTFGGSVGGAIGVAYGSAIGAAVGTTEVGAAIATAIATEIGASVGSVLPVIGTIIGAAIGSFLGSVFGSIFGPGKSVGPDGTAILNYSTANHNFYTGGVSVDNGGDANFVSNLGASADAEINGILSYIGGTIMNAASLPVFAVGYYEERGTFGGGSGSSLGPYFSSSNAGQQAADAVVTYMASVLQIQGGNPFMEYALNYSGATTVSALIAAINAANDYGNYLANPALFDLNISLANDQTQLNNWLSEMQLAQQMGLSTAPNSSNLIGGKLYATAAYVAANLAIISDFITSNDITSIFLTDPGTSTLYMTDAQQTQYQDILNVIANDCAVLNPGETFSYSGAVVDNAVDIAINIDTLETLVNNHTVTSITLNDGGTPSLTLSVAQLLNDSAALAKIVSPYALIVRDSSTNIIANIATLNTMTISGKITEIDLTDTGTPNVYVIAADAQYLSALQHIYTSYSLVINDSMANVMANLSAIKTLVNNHLLAAIDLTDTTAPSVTLTSAQISSDQATFALINGHYTIVMSDTTTTLDVTLSDINLTAGNSNTLKVDGSADTLTVGNANTLNITGNNNTATLGTGGKVNVTGTNDTVSISSGAVAGTTVNGGTGKTILDVTGGNTVTLGSNISGIATVNLEAAPAGQTQPDYDFVANAIAGLTVNDLSSGNDSLTGDATGQILNGGSGMDIFQSDSVNETLNGGSGTNYFDVPWSATSIAGTVINGGTGTNIINTWDGDLSVLTINNVPTLNANQDWVAMTAAQFSAFTTLNAENSPISLIAKSDGTYNLTTKTVTGTFDLDASQTTGIDTLVGNNQAAQTLKAGSGTDTLTAGNGAGDILYAGSGTDTLNAGTGNDTLDGGTGTSSYKFGATFGQDTVNNAYAGNTTAKGEIDFTASGVTDENLWFSKSGNNLLIQLLGTTDSITVSNWYGSNAGADVQTFNAGGLKLDTQLAQLIQAMATYSSAHSGFNPSTTSSMPTDTTLQSAISSAWHH